MCVCGGGDFGTILEIFYIYIYVYIQDKFYMIFTISFKCYIFIYYLFIIYYIFVYYLIITGLLLYLLTLHVGGGRKLLHFVLSILKKIFSIAALVLEAPSSLGTVRNFPQAFKNWPPHGSHGLMRYTTLYPSDEGYTTL